MDVCFCCECAKEIDGFGLAVSVWEEISFEYAISGGPYRIEIDEYLPLWPVIIFLENRGFLITTDIEEDLYLIKPAGARFDEGCSLHVCKKAEGEH